jgi:protein SCO1/2
VAAVSIVSLLAAIFFVGAAVSRVAGQVAEESLEPLEGVEIVQKLDSQIPLETRFRDDRGRDIKLGQLFSGERPVLLSLNYSDCPMLCQLQLNGLVDALGRMKWLPGREFEIVSVSINPLETPTRARQAKQHYVKLYGKPQSADGWHFLTGDKNSIDTLAEAVGFGYRYVPERQEYAHAAALMVCTPGGRVSRYLFDVTYDPGTLKLSLVEAGEGKIGSPLDQFLLFCFHYDAEAGKYGPAARQMMKVFGGLTLAALLIGLVPVWLRHRHRRPAKEAEPLTGDGHPEPVASPTTDDSHHSKI